MTDLSIAIKQRGAARVAAALGITVQRLLNWLSRGVPVEYCAPLELALGGAVTRRDLRPDDWHLIWPELAADSEQNQAPAGTTPAQAAINEVASGEGVNACAD